MSLTAKTKRILTVAMANKAAATELADTVDALIEASLISITETIEEGDDTHAPTGGAVYDALAEKLDADAVSQTIADEASEVPSNAAVYDALADKQDEAYTPTTGGDWDPAPTTVQGALDQLAARLTVVEGA